MGFYGIPSLIDFRDRLIDLSSKMFTHQHVTWGMLNVVMTMTMMTCTCITLIIECYRR